MPMFEDTMELAQSGELPPKERSPPRPRPLSPIERASTPSKPISIPTSPYHSRRMSEESIRTELCEGPLSTSPMPLPPSFTSRPSPPAASNQPAAAVAVLPPPQTPSDRENCGQVTDRAELIARIKRGESPTWIPNRHLESAYHSRSPTSDSRPPSAGSPTTASTLLPPANITPERVPLEAHNHDAEAAVRLEDGLSIERPRSALHSGDFTHGTSSSSSTRRQSRLADETEGRRARAPPLTAAAPDVATSPWVATSPPRHYTPFAFDHRSPPTASLTEFGVFRSGGGASPSSSISSSFVYKPPTSPLVQSQSNNDEDDDTSDGAMAMNNIDIALSGSPVNKAGSMRPNSRRHTMAFPHYRHSQSSLYSAPVTSHPLPLHSPGSARRESVLPYQAHQPRRSLSVNNQTKPDHLPSFNSISSPQTPLLSTSRRPSFTMDTSPLQHASMVGSYEESILRGRMSTTPSRPLDFLAQIGVLGLGANCKPGLRCPAHVTLPFSAVFYSYATTSYGRSKADDGPSPYVGLVDLENGLPDSGADQRSKRKAMMLSRRMASRTQTAQLNEMETSSAINKSRNAQEDKRPGPGGSIMSGGDTAMEDVHVERLDLSDTEVRKLTASSTRSHKRRQQSPRAPPGGSYRIPEQGQLQIIIKNQNKTAVKLFLIPYNLTGMEPGTKTFIRQRSYSAGPIIDSMPAKSETSSDRPILRYLIHVHICCPSRGRFYLYKSIRVVFANRVPDGKEKLRNEITLPEPLYSPYKPIRVMHAAPSLSGSGGPGAALAAEKAYRRRSSGYSFSAHGVSQGGFDPFGIHHPPVPAVPTVSNLPKSASAASALSWSDQKAGISPSFSQTESGRFDGPRLGDLNFSEQTKSTEPTSQEDDSSGSGSKKTASVPSSGLPLYTKLSKGDVGYGGNAFVSGRPTSESLLSQRLRSLETEKTPPLEESI